MLSRRKFLGLAGTAGALFAAWLAYYEFRPLRTVDAKLSVLDGHIHLANGFGDGPQIIAQFKKYGIQRGLVFASPVRQAPNVRPPKFYLKVINNSPMGTFFLRSLSSAGLADIVLPQPDNQAVYQAFSRYPKQLRGLVFVNPNLTTAQQEMINGIEQYNFSGIKMHLYMHPIRLNDTRLIPIWEYAQAKHLPILYDIGIESALATPIFDIALKYPQIPFIIPHLGGTLFDLTMENVRKSENIFLDTSGYTVTQERLHLAYQQVGAERLIFGSDSPPELGGDPSDSLDMIAETIPNPAEQQQILATNLMQLLNWRD